MSKAVRNATILNLRSTAQIKWENFWQLFEKLLKKVAFSLVQFYDAAEEAKMPQLK